jgi:uncharacterized Zn-binding protein involved in type VI secretion
MPPPGRIGDIGSGHGSFPPTTVIQGSPNTFVNSIPVHRVGDAIAAHGSPSPSGPHGRAGAAGSPNTYVNLKAIMRIGDPITCGGVIATGSHNTIIN